MSQVISRRRFVAIMAAAVPLAKVGTAWAAAPQRWRGIAMGAHAQILLLHHDAAKARAALAAAVAELTRLEAIFSLYEPNSEISRLNRDGYLAAPSVDLVRLLSEAAVISQTTDGAFDVTVQPLFETYRDLQGARPATKDLAGALALVDHRDVEVAPGRVRFRKPGMKITLNGIAQGFITDRICELLRRHGFPGTLTNLGEIKANGTGPDGAGWPVSIEASDAGAASPVRLDLKDRALATSAAGGYRFGQKGAGHHLLDPRMGLSAAHYGSLSVLAPTATLADGLSTAFSMLPPNALPFAAARFDDINIIAETAGGDILRL